MIDKFAYRLDKLKNNCSNYLSIFFLSQSLMITVRNKAACKLLLFASNNVIGLCLHSNYSARCQINNIISKLLHLNNHNNSSSKKIIRRSNRKGNWKMFGLFKERFDIIRYEGLSHALNWPYVLYCMQLFSIRVLNENETKKIEP